MGTKADNLSELLAANPEMADWTADAITQAFKAAYGQSVSNETVRLGRKAFREQMAEAVETLEDEVAPDSEPFAFAAEDEQTAEEYDEETTADDEAEDEAREDEESAREAVEAEDDVFEEYDAPEGGAADEDGEDDPDILAASAAAAEAIEKGEDPVAAAIHAAEQVLEAKAAKKVDNDSATGAPGGASDAVGSDQNDSGEVPGEKAITREPVEGRCNHKMERAGDLCGRPEGHPGVHTTYAQMESKKAYSKAHAKSRYHSDPAYADRVKAASRASHKKARDAAKAAKEAAAAAPAGAGE